MGYLSLFLVDIEGFPLGHVEAPLNVNEKQLVEELLTRVLGECIEVELLAGDSQLESQGVFDLRVPEDKRHNRLEAAEGPGEPSRRALG